MKSAVQAQQEDENRTLTNEEVHSLSAEERLALLRANLHENPRPRVVITSATSRYQKDTKVDLIEYLDYLANVAIQNHKEKTNNIN